MGSGTPDEDREVEVVEQDLLAEFGHRVPKGQLSRIAYEEVHAFDGARVRDFVAILAWRQARERAKTLAP